MTNTRKARTFMKLGKVYLAARYSRHVELQGYRDLLETLGVEVICRWIDGDYPVGRDGLSLEPPVEERARVAFQDYEDLIQCETCISFTEEPRSKPGRGGRHVEFGIALESGKQCIVIGPRETVFHCLPKVMHYEEWTDFLNVWFPLSIPGEKEW